MFAMALKIVLKLNRGRLIGSILTLDTHERKTAGFFTFKQRQSTSQQIVFLNIKTELLYHILKQSYENFFLVSFFQQYIVTWIRVVTTGAKRVIFLTYLLLDIWEHCLLNLHSLLIFSFSKEQIWQFLWVVINLL